MQTFAEQLNAMRKERHITQEQLAQELNVSRTTISRWESGKVLPDIETIKRLSQVLNYNFFAVEGQVQVQSVPTMAPPVPEEIERRDMQPIRKNHFVWMLAIGCLCLLVICFILLFEVMRSSSDKPAANRQMKAEIQSTQPPTAESVSGETNNATPENTQHPAMEPATTEPLSVRGAADIVITPSDTVAYLDIIAVEEGAPVYGWHVDFLFENRSAVPFTIEKIVGYYYENDTLCAVLPVRYKDLRPHMKNDKLRNTDGTLEWSFSSDQKNMTHMICTIYGIDDNGNEIEVSTTVQYSQVSADVAEGP